MGYKKLAGIGDAGSELQLLLYRSPCMTTTPVSIEIVEEGDERFVLKVYADGSHERVPIVNEPPKPKRLSKKIAWYRDLRTGRKKFY